MQGPQSLGLLNVRLPVDLGEKLPPAAELLGDLGIVLVRRHLHNLPPLQLGPHHESIHGPLNVIWWVLLCLQREEKERKSLLGHHCCGTTKLSRKFRSRGRRHRVLATRGRLRAFAKIIFFAHQMRLNLKRQSVHFLLQEKNHFPRKSPQQTSL